jgi:HD superfamily phosphohydrolase
LLSRYFDYQQISFHKTVAALEMLLKDVMRAVIERGLFNCSEDAVQKAIADGTWAQLDEPYVWGLIRQLASEGQSVDAFKAQALLDRKVPKLVLHYERVDGLDRHEDFALRQNAWSAAKESASTEFGIDSSLWYLWHKPGITLTKVGSRVPVGTMQDGASSKERDKYEQSIRIMGDDGSSSNDIMSEPQSLMSILSNSALYALRIYVLLPPDKKGLADAITERMQAMLKS